jgi:hypothetical protein
LGARQFFGGKIEAALSGDDNKRAQMPQSNIEVFHSR